jgi:hypothetical protein
MSKTNGNGRLLVYQDGGWGVIPPPKALAIVGSHPATRELAPWDDPRFEIWLFNESAQKPSIYKRWDALLQIHQEKVYASLTNWVNKDHWEWLQQNHGPDKRIFMQDVDPRIPNSVKYPLEEVLALVPYHYLRSSPAMSLALAIYLGYKEIWLYGSELSSGTEYAYQAINYAFWIGFAHGRGIDLHLECWQSEFNQPIYGYEGEAQIPLTYYAERAMQHASARKGNDSTVEKLQDRIKRAMIDNDPIKVGELSLNLETALQAAGEAAGAQGEAERYAKREDMISRQEFERTAGYAMIDGEKFQKDMYFASGKVEFVWNAWKNSGRLEHLNALRGFIKERNDAAYKMGLKLGVYRENIHYQSEYDKYVQAMGGKRALHHIDPALVTA